MSRFEVVTESLHAAAGPVEALGREVSELAGEAAGLAQAGAAGSPEAAASLASFSVFWTSGLSRLGDAVGGLGVALDAAATLYETVETANTAR